MPGGVVGTVKPSWWDRSRLFCHFSRSLRCTSNLGLIPRPCLACLWGSRQFSQPCDHRWFQIRQCNRASSLLETWWGLGWWARPNKDLAFASLFGTVDTLQSISQDIHEHHYGGTERWRKELKITFLIRRKTLKLENSGSINIGFFTALIMYQVRAMDSMFPHISSGPTTIDYG